MCGVTEVAAATALASTAFQVKQARDQSSFQQGTAEFNARVAENEAERTREIATEQENTQRQRTAEFVSRQRAQLGAAGVDLASGSALQLQQDTETLGDIDALRIRTRGEDQFAALTREADFSTAQGGFAKQAGRNQEVGSLLTGGANVLGTGVADKWLTPDSAANQVNLRRIDRAGV